MKKLKIEESRKIKQEIFKELYIIEQKLHIFLERDYEFTIEDDKNGEGRDNYEWLEAMTRITHFLNNKWFGPTKVLYAIDEIYCKEE